MIEHVTEQLLTLLILCCTGIPFIVIYIILVIKDKWKAATIFGIIYTIIFGTHFWGILIIPATIFAGYKWHKQKKMEEEVDDELLH